MEGKARTRPDILRVVLGPYVQYCPCEAWGFGAKTRAKTKKSELKKIELSYCHHSICLKKIAFITIGMSKFNECPFNVLAQKWHMAYFVPIDGHFGQILCDMNFKFVLPIIYIIFNIQPKFEVTQTHIGHSIPIYPLVWSQKACSINKSGETTITSREICTSKSSYLTQDMQLTVVLIFYQRFCDVPCKIKSQ